MLLIPLNEAQEAFVEVEILGRHLDDDDPKVRAIVEIVAEHFERSGGKALAVSDAEVVKTLILDAINGLDDSIVSKRTEHEHSLNAKDARRLHATGSSLLKAVTRYQRAKGLGEVEEDNLEVARTIAAQIGRGAFRMLGAKDFVGDAKSLTFKIGRNGKGVTHIRITLDPDDTYTVEFLAARRLKSPPYFERKVLSTSGDVYVDRLHRTIEYGTEMYTSI
jgi:hypothetical protein